MTRPQALTTRTVAGYAVERPVVVRVAGLPVDVLSAMRFTRTVAAVDALLDAQDRARRTAQVLSEALYPLVGDPANAALKTRLVALRRAIHQDRRLPEHVWNAEIRGALPAPMVCRIDAWHAERAARIGAEADLEPLLGVEADTVAARIRDAAGRPEFRRALAQASPDLSAALERWLRDGHRPRARTIGGLVAFLGRAAAKTSPYSSFARIGLAHVDDTGPSAPAGAHPVPASSVLEFDRVLVARLVRAVSTRPDLAATLVLRVNPSLHRAGETLRFLGTGETIVTMAAAPAVLACLDVVRHRQATTADVVRHLAATGAAAAKVGVFVDRLVAVGLLEARPPVQVEGAEPLGALADWLEATGADVRLLRELDRLMSVPTRIGDHTELAAHRERLVTAVAHTVRLGHDLAVPDWPDADRLDRFVCHEHVVESGAPARLDARAWRPVLDDLDVVRRWLGLHDPMLPTRLALADRWAPWFGSAPDIAFLDLHERVQRELAARTPLSAYLRGDYTVGAADLATSPVERHARLHALLTESIAELTGPQRVDPELVRRLTASWPAWVTAPASITCYGQAVPGADGPRLAVNVITGGHGRGRGRWAHLAERATGTPVTAPPAADRPDGPIVAELAGLFGSALNLHVALSTHEISYPGTEDTRPPRHRIALGALRVRQDPGTGLPQLFDAATGRQVIPVHAGMMADLLLPPAARLLLAAFGPAYLVHPAWPVLCPLLDPATVTAPTLLPRVEVGRVVLQRARWLVPAAAVPRQRPGDTGAGHLQRLLGWQRETGIPRASYVRLWDPEQVWGQRAFTKARKPVYVDLANWYAVQNLDRLLADWSGLVTFEEPLPAPQDAAERVAELMFELTAVGSTE
ncbi:lantibiotic dehydratase [Dactylosporangium sp. CA-152071]|uniref:lantibiotic dehydratase n=1 Tax=Dactylosporangium sp. CA-152071 TaxID=3239933 RepID=UPI003D91F776